MIERYLVAEVNEGVYLTVELDTSDMPTDIVAQKDYKFHHAYGFTTDIKQAHKLKDTHANFNVMRQLAEKCGGKLRKYKISHEVL